jgi:protein subunit release factor A
LVVSGRDHAGAKQLFMEAGQDLELKEMARAEMKELEARQEELEKRLMVLMLPQVESISADEAR